jgi:hypothetical protein
MKCLAFFFVIVCVLLLVSAYVAESPVGAAARADYIKAQVDKETAEAQQQRAQAIKLELENAHSEKTHQQQLVHNHQSWLAEEARRDSLNRVREQQVRLLGHATAATIVIIGLAVFYWMVQGRVRLLAAREREAQARAEAQEKERQAYEARVNALKVQRGLLVQQHQFELARLIAEGKLDEQVYTQRPAPRVN